MKSCASTLRPQPLLVADAVLEVGEIRRVELEEALRQLHDD
jgi:hypothetical protein